MSVRRFPQYAGAAGAVLVTAWTLVACDDDGSDAGGAGASLTGPAAAASRAFKQPVGIVTISEARGGGPATAVAAIT